MNRPDQEPAFVLHARPYRETSQLLEVLTRHHGRVGLIARGSRRAKGSRSGLLQPFIPLLVGWRGRGELPVLAHCERHPDHDAALPPERLAVGLYVNELVVRLVPRGDVHERLFQHYARVLAELRHLDEVETALRRFEVQLLGELGYGMEWARDSETGQPVSADQLYCVEIERGPVPVASRQASDWCVSGASLQALESGRYVSQDQRRECRRLMAAVIRHYLGGAELKSRTLFAKDWKRP